MCSFDYDSEKLLGVVKISHSLLHLSSSQSPVLFPRMKTAFAENKLRNVEDNEKNVNAELKEFILDAFDDCFVQCLERR